MKIVAFLARTIREIPGKENWFEKQRITKFFFHNVRTRNHSSVSQHIKPLDTIIAYIFIIKFIIRKNAAQQSQKRVTTLHLYY